MALFVGLLTLCRSSVVAKHNCEPAYPALASLHRLPLSHRKPSQHFRLILKAVLSSPTEVLSCFVLCAAGQGSCLCTDYNPGSINTWDHVRNHSL